MATDAIVGDGSVTRTAGPGIDAASDASLVRRVIEGSEEALGHLYDKHGEAVYAAALRASRDPAVAAEVVQDTFLTLWNRAEHFDPSRGALPAWLVTIARHRAVDRHRASGRHERAATFSSFGGPDEDHHTVGDWLTTSGELVGAATLEPGPEGALSRKETREAVQAALASLAPMERSVILLAYAGGLSQSEIATRLGWPIGTVKTRTRRALRQLRDVLERPTHDRSAIPGAERVAASPFADPSLRPVPEVEDNGRSWWSGVASGYPAPATTSCQG